MWHKIFHSAVYFLRKVAKIVTRERFLMAETFRKVRDKYRRLATRLYVKRGGIIDNAPVKIKGTTSFGKKNKKILILKLDHLGDSILAILAMMKLKDRYPYSTIDIALGSRNRPVVEKPVVFSNILVFDFFEKDP